MCDIRLDSLPSRNVIKGEQKVLLVELFKHGGPPFKYNFAPQLQDILAEEEQEPYNSL